MVIILYKLCSTGFQDATYKVSRQPAQRFWRRRLFKVSTTYGDLNQLHKFSFSHRQKAAYEIKLKIAQ